jgi:hypothetical protein
MVEGFKSEYGNPEGGAVQAPAQMPFPTQSPPHDHTYLPRMPIRNLKKNDSQASHLLSSIPSS